MDFIKDVVKNLVIKVLRNKDIFGSNALVQKVKFQTLYAMGVGDGTYEPLVKKIVEQDNPIGPSSGVRKILRGGGWYNAEVYADPRMRFRLYPEAKISSIGFRCAKNRTDKEIPNGLD